MKWYPLLVMLILIAAALGAGCTDDESAVAPPPPGDAVQPGQVLVNTGDVTGDGIPRGTIDTITFRVGLAPGEKPVNMENITIVYADAIRTETLVPVEGYRGEPPAGTWGILNVENQIGYPNNRLEDQEQFVIRINPKAPLVPRQLVTIIVKTPTGTPLNIRRVAPPTIIAKDNLLAPI